MPSNTHHIGPSADSLSLSRNPLDLIHYARAKLAVLLAVDYETATDFDQFEFGLSVILGEISQDLKRVDELLTGQRVTP